MSIYGSPDSIQCFDSLEYPDILEPEGSELYFSQVDSFHDLNNYFDVGLEYIASISPTQNAPWAGQPSYDSRLCFDIHSAAQANPQWYHCSDVRAAWSDSETVRRLQSLHMPPPQPLEPPILDPTFGVGTWMAEENGGYVRPAAAALSSSVNQCLDCPRSFATAYLLEQHAKLEKHPSFECTVSGCDRRYCRRDTLSRHIASHKDSESHECPVCVESSQKRVFKRRDHLLQHVRNRHPLKYDMLDSSRQVTASNGDLSDGVRQDKRSIDSSRLTHSQRTSPEPQGPTYLSASGHSRQFAKDPNAQSQTVQEIASALSSILGANHIAVQMIEQSPEGCDGAMKEELALSLAEMVLAEPDRLPPQAKEQLLRTSANRSPRLKAHTYP